jgi:hypothetical protein
MHGVTLAVIGVAACVSPAEGGGGILGAPVDMICLAFMMGGIVIFTIGFETATEKLEEALEEQPAYWQMLFKTYKELMIMGIISFSLTVSYELGVSYDHDTFICFEFAHILIFFVAVLYIGNAICASLSMERTRASWDRMANETLDMCVEGVNSYVAAVEGNGFRKFMGSIPIPSPGWREETDYKILRYVFLRDYFLPLNFDYTSYIRSKLMEIVKEVVEISIKTWCVVLAICGFTVSVRLIVRAVSPDEPSAEDGRRMLGGGGNSSGLRFPLMSPQGPLTEAQAVANIWVLGGTAWLLLLGQLALLVFILAQKAKLINEDMKRVLGKTELPPTKSVEMAKMLPEYLLALGTQVTKQAQKLAEEASVQAKAINISRKLATAYVRTKAAKTGIHADVDGFVSQHAEVCSHSTIHRIEFANQTISLLNCFYMGFYIVHVRPHVSTAEMEILPNFIVHVLLIAPCLLLVFWASPSTAKELALFMGVLHEDKELVGEVFHLMEEVIEIRDVLKAGLIDVARGWSDEEPDFNIDFTQDAVAIATEAARVTFERMDLDQGGTLDYREFRMGLDKFKIHLPSREFKKLIRVIDPDQSGELDLQEWINFFSMSEEDIVEQSIENNNPKGLLQRAHSKDSAGSDTAKSGGDSPDVKIYNPMAPDEEISQDSRTLE